MATIRLYSPTPGADTSLVEFISAMFSSPDSIRMTSSKMTITTNEVRAVLAGQNLSYLYDESFGLPLPAPATGSLDSLTIRLDSNNKTILTIEDWDITGQRFLNGISGTGEEIGIFNIFLGGDDRIFGTSASDEIIGLSGHDSVYGGGGTDSLSGFSGKDVLLGGKGFDTLSGDVGNDRLYGGQGSDRMLGALGNDLLSGGSGADTLIGGGGTDVFLFNSALGAGQVDMVDDFTVGQDRFQLDDDIFTTVGAPGTLQATALRIGLNATTAAQRIIYDPVSGSLWYDKDGVGGIAKVQIAVMDTGLALTASHFQIIG